MSGGKRSSCRVWKVLSGGRPESRSKRAMRCSSRWMHSARISSYRNASWVRLALAALSATSSNCAAMAGKRSVRSIARNSSWRSSMRHLATEQLVVDAQVEHRRAELRNRLSRWRTHQIAYSVEGRDHVLVEQHADNGLDLRLGRAGGQVQQPHVVPIGALGGVRAERV